MINPSSLMLKAIIWADPLHLFMLCLNTVRALFHLLAGFLNDLDLIFFFHKKLKRDNSD